ncbi:MAG: glycosyltransferase [Clostridia bacterium]|nr:glycosyltransferase [Clostridia bacterium]MBQ7095791.1 glycosyltransferase [Clostridia bacterium]
MAISKAIDLIIPIYNRADLIPGLIQTLEGQRMKDFRVIFVDDGSKDNSYNVLAELLPKASLDFLILQQENKGPSAARNFGITHAEADWIAFCDSDDILLPEYLEYLLGAVEGKDAQMGYCRLQVIPVGDNTPIKPAGSPRYSLLTSAEAMHRHYTDWIAPVCLILNRKWVQSNQLIFDEGCRYCEDLMFITECLNAAEHVCECDNQLYVYRTHEGSLLRSSDTTKYIDGLNGFERLEKKLQGCNTTAAKVFFEMGKARFLLGILRRAALQLSKNDFLKLTKLVEFKKCSYQIKRLPRMQHIAGRLYQISKLLFYYSARILFSD